QRRTADAAFPDRVLAGVLTGVGSGPVRRHRRALSAGRARYLRLPHRLLLAGAGAGPAQSRARLDRKVRRRAEGLAKAGLDLPMTMKTRLVLVGALAALAVLPVRTAEKRISAGNGTLIIGSYPKQFWIIDEATEKIVGTIPFQSGIPRRTSISLDRKRFYTV